MATLKMVQAPIDMPMSAQERHMIAMFRLMTDETQAFYEISWEVVTEPGSSSLRAAAPKLTLVGGAQ